jgi:hypothetical protein
VGGNAHGFFVIVPPFRISKETKAFWLRFIFSPNRRSDDFFEVPDGVSKKNYNQEKWIW